MDYIFLIASFNAFFFAALLLNKKPKALHDAILFYWLLYLGFFIGLNTFGDNLPFSNFKLFPAYVTTLFLLHGPFLYLYTLALTSHDRVRTKKSFLHFIPFILFLAYLVIASFYPEYSGRISLDHVSTHVPSPTIFVLMLLMTAISGPVYFYLSIVAVQKHKQKYLDNFSTIEKINLNWLRILLYLFGIIWLILIIIAITHHVFHYASMDFCINGLFLSLSAFILLIGYYGLRQTEIFTRLPEVVIPKVENKIEEYDYDSKEKYINIPLSEDELSGYIDKITTYMDNEKPWLNPELTLPLLAAGLEIPTHHLSRVINEKFGRNFFDFINEYRVNEFKNKLFNPTYHNFSLLGIAFECGFNSKSAFNRVFKKTTGLTPSEYKNSQRK